MTIKVRKTIALKFNNEWASADLIIWSQKDRCAINYKGRAQATIGNFYSRKRRCGYGSDVMRQICEFADDNNIQIGMGVDPYGPGITEENYYEKRNERIAFYKKFGFKNRGNGWFVRTPTKSQK